MGTMAVNVLELLMVNFLLVLQPFIVMILFVVFDDDDVDVIQIYGTTNLKMKPNN